MDNNAKNNETFFHLTQLGWSDYFQGQMERFAGEKLFPARVIGVEKNMFRAADGKDEWLATLAGRLLHQASGAYPVIGDWVLMHETVIDQVLERRNALSRGAAGSHDRQGGQARRGQTIAANLDTIFVVCGLDRDYNPGRIERCVTLAYNCGMNPVIILTKADLQPTPERFAAEAAEVALGADVHLVSAEDDACLAALEPYLAWGRTAAMIGSSGAGKSTLLNRLHGQNVQPTGAVSVSVGKGRHTTTSRSLIMMPQGGMMIDNPGVREIALWGEEDGVGEAFADIEELGRDCRFADCSHTHEPGCRVLRAVESGVISGRRLENYRKMKREMEYLAQRSQMSAERVEKERWKEITLLTRSFKKR